MGLIRSFDGFPRAGLQFLSDLAANNNRDWFEDHRETYQTQLLGPLQTFVDALGVRLQDDFPQLDFDPAANGSGSLTRIYRDIRFSKDKSPYKTWMGMRFWHQPFGRKVGPGLFVALDHENGIGLYAGVWCFDKPLLAAWRRWVDQGTAMDELAEAVRPVADCGLGGRHYKRVPRGMDKDHPRADLLLHNGLHVVMPRIAKRELSRPGLVEACASELARAKPLHDWLVAFYESNLES